MNKIILFSLMLVFCTTLKAEFIVDTKEISRIKNVDIKELFDDLQIIENRTEIKELFDDTFSLWGTIFQDSDYLDLFFSPGENGVEPRKSFEDLFEIMNSVRLIRIMTKFFVQDDKFESFKYSIEEGIEILIEKCIGFFKEQKEVFSSSYTDSEGFYLSKPGTLLFRNLISFINQTSFEEIKFDQDFQIESISIDSDKNKLKELIRNILKETPTEILPTAPWTKTNITQDTNFSPISKEHLMEFLKNISDNIIIKEPQKISDKVIEIFKGILSSAFKKNVFNYDHSYPESFGPEELIDRIENLDYSIKNEYSNHIISELTSIGLTPEIKKIESYSSGVRTSYERYYRNVFDNVDPSSNGMKIAGAIIGALSSTGMGMTIAGGGLGGAMLGPMIQGVGALTMGASSIAQVIMVFIDIYEARRPIRDFKTEFITNYKKFIDHDKTGTNICLDPSDKSVDIHLGYRSNMDGLIGTHYKTVWTDTLASHMILVKDKNTVFESDVTLVCFTGKLKMKQGNIDPYVRRIYSKDESNYYKVTNLNSMMSNWDKVEFTCGSETMLTIENRPIIGIKEFSPKVFSGEDPKFRFAPNDVCDQFYLKKIGYSYYGCEFDLGKKLNSYLTCQMLLELAVWDSDTKKFYAFTDIKDQDNNQMKVFSFTPGKAKYVFRPNLENERRLCSHSSDICQLPFVLTVRPEDDLRRRIYEVEIGQEQKKSNIPYITKLGISCVPGSNLKWNDKQNFTVFKHSWIPNNWIISGVSSGKKYSELFWCQDIFGKVSDQILVSVVTTKTFPINTVINTIIEANSEPSEERLFNSWDEKEFNISIQNSIKVIDTKNNLGLDSTKYGRPLKIDFKPDLGDDAWDRMKDGNHSWGFIKFEFGVSGLEFYKPLDTAEYSDQIDKTKSYNSLIKDLEFKGDQGCRFIIKPHFKILTIECSGGTLELDQVKRGERFYLAFETSDEFCSTNNPTPFCNTIQLGGKSTITDKDKNVGNFYPLVDIWKSDLTFNGVDIPEIKKKVNGKYNGKFFADLYFPKDTKDYRFNGQFWCCDAGFARSQITYRGIGWNKRRGIDLIQKVDIVFEEKNPKDPLGISQENFETIFKIWERISEIGSSKSDLTNLVENYNNLGLTISLSLDNLMVDIENHENEIKNKIDLLIKDAWETYISILDKFKNQSLYDYSISKDYFCCAWNETKVKAEQVFGNDSRFSCDSVFKFKDQNTICYNEYGKPVCKKYPDDLMYHTCFDKPYFTKNLKSYKEYIKLKNLTEGIDSIINILDLLSDYLKQIDNEYSLIENNKIDIQIDKEELDIITYNTKEGSDDKKNITVIFQVPNLFIYLIICLVIILIILGIIIFIIIQIKNKKLFKNPEQEFSMNKIYKDKMVSRSFTSIPDSDCKTALYSLEEDIKKPIDEELLSILNGKL